MIAYDLLKTKDKEFLAVTGLTHEEFLHLLPAFDTLYQDATRPANDGRKTPQAQTRRRSQRQISGKANRNCSFILAYTKAYELQTFLGCILALANRKPTIGYSVCFRSCSKRWPNLSHTPERDPAKVAEYTLAPTPRFPISLLDGTERRRQRPKDPDAQKENYSGKKKPTPTRT